MWFYNRPSLVGAAEGKKKMISMVVIVALACSLGTAEELYAEFASPIIEEDAVRPLDPTAKSGKCR